MLAAAIRQSPPLSDDGGIKMQLTGGEIVAEYLIAEGVPYVAGIPGHGCLALFDALRDRQDRIGVIQVRHEQAAAHIADGHFRVSGKPLAVYTSIGPGATNTVIGAATAYVDSMPLLIVTGNVHTHMRGRGVLQEIERTHWANWPRILEPVVKRHWTVGDVRQLPFVLQRAFAEMLGGRMGPVLVDLPMDVQAAAAEVEIPAPTGHRPRARPVGDPDEIARAAALLSSAKRPAILAGGGVLSSGASAELRAVAEYVGAPVITTLQGKSAFPEDHPLSAWLGGSKGTDVGNHIARSSDVLLAVGCRFADETTSSYRHGVTYAIPPTRLIHIDLDPTEIGKNYPVEVGIVGDAKACLAALLDALQAERVPTPYKASGYFAELQRVKQEWFASLAAAQTSDAAPMTISRALRELRGWLGRDAIVAYSSGNTQAQILQEFPFYEPMTSLTTGGFSTMGWGYTAALGAKLALPERQVVAVVGDGDFLMTMQEMATAAQYGIAVVAFVVNNVGWISIKDLQMAAYGQDRAFASDFVRRDGSLCTPDLTAAARAFGLHAERIEAPGQVRPALERAFSSGGPALIEVMANRVFPTSGGRACGWWDVPVPTYLQERRKRYEREREEERL
jgi:acetolactate synthase-1/2/3 large subunit